MTEESKNIDFNQDADIKIEKLKEVVDDILDNGTMGGDQTSRQLVITAITKSENETLFKKLEGLLFDKKEKELLKTMVAGFFLQKERYSPLIEYTNKLIPQSLVLTEEFEDKESLILVLDALVKATDSKNEEVREDALGALISLYKASCSQNSTALIADQLLQRFINILPMKNSLIDNKLIDLVNDTETDINSRLVAIDILSKTRSEETYQLIEKIIFEIESYTSSDEDRLYMLDVTTKALVNYSSSFYSERLRNILKELNSIDFIVKGKNDSVEVICRRIKSRLKNLNDSINSVN